MFNKSIINGIDVNECECLNPLDNGVYECILGKKQILTYRVCDCNHNCYFKQLARAKEEIEKWKHQAELGSDTTDRLTKDIERLSEENEKLKSQIENEKQALQIDIDNLNQACLDLSQENEELKHQIEDVDTLCSEKESLIDKYLQTIEQVKKFVAGLMFDVDCTNWFERFVVAFENWKSELGNDRDKYKKALDDIEKYCTYMNTFNEYNKTNMGLKVDVVLDLISKAKGNKIKPQNPYAVYK